MENTFDSKIRECIRVLRDNIDLVYSPKYKEYQTYCERLFTYAAQEESDELFAIAYYYMMMFYASDNDCVNTITCGHEGIKYQLQIGDYEKAARSYNVLGVYTNIMGDVTSAIDHYMTCMDLCDEHGFSYIRGMACSNMGDLFRRNLCYERALHYYDLATRYLELEAKKKPEIQSLGNLSCLLCSKGYCYLSMGKKEEAEELARRLEAVYERLTELGENRDDFCIHTFFASVSFALGDYQEVEKQLSYAQKYFHQSDNYTDYMDDIFAYIELYMELQRIWQTVEILDYFIKKCEDDGASFYIYSQFLVKRIDCARILHNHADYEEYTERFMHNYRERAINSMDAVLRAENSHKEKRRMKKSQEEITVQNEELLVKSNHDTLTQLPNRAYWHSYAEVLLTKAAQKQHNVGIEILDIDCFKNVNDTYGHIEGDRYLTEVANALFVLAQNNQQIFVARYGGDEFIIVYENMTDAQIAEQMQSLKDMAQAIALADNSPLGLPYITLSQGCCNHVPLAINRLWDYLAYADRLLYQVKREGKNGYLVKDAFHSNTK